jgi:hypothetical protein
MLALNFGGSQSLNEITVDQVRRFTDTAGLPASPVWEVVREVVQRTAAAWKTLDQKDINVIISPRPSTCGCRSNWSHPI